MTGATPVVGYRDLLRSAHVAPFLAAALVGRLSQGTAGLATLLLVQRATGSYAVAGAAVGCLGATAAVSAPARTRWLYRCGPGRALSVLAVGHALVLAVVALAGIRLGSTPMALPGLCALAGCLTPPLGPATRVMWSVAVGAQPDLLRRAYSLDAAADEVLFMLGPGIAGFAVALGGPCAGVVLTAALALVGTLGVATSPLVRVAPRATPGPTGQKRVAPLRAAGFARLLLVMLGVGTTLGGVELVAVELGGHGGSAGPGTLVATVALGGAVGSIAYGRRAWRRAHGPQLTLLCTALTGALSGTLAAVASPAPLTVALLPVALCLCGTVVAPALVVAYGLADRLTDPCVRAEAGALVTTANNLGASVGTAAAAFVVDHGGVRVTLLVLAAAAAATTAATSTFRSGTRSSGPTANVPADTTPGRRPGTTRCCTAPRPAGRGRRTAVGCRRVRRQLTGSPSTSAVGACGHPAA